jgi:hypothetical protein
MTPPIPSKHYGTSCRSKVILLWPLASRSRGAVAQQRDILMPVLHKRPLNLAPGQIARLEATADATLRAAHAPAQLPFTGM